LFINNLSCIRLKRGKKERMVLRDNSDAAVEMEAEAQSTFAV
jgi:hypothetical protein